jgi:hypothetical protein
MAVTLDYLKNLSKISDRYNLNRPIILFKVDIKILKPTISIELAELMEQELINQEIIIKTMIETYNKETEKKQERATGIKRTNKHADLT